MNATPAEIDPKPILEVRDVTKHYRMGSENIWQACSFMWFDYAYFGDRSFNALQNIFQGGNFSNYRQRAILIRAGTARASK